MYFCSILLLLSSHLVSSDLSKFKEFDYDNEIDDNSIEARSDKKSFKPDGNIDFSGCEVDPDSGKCCIFKEEEITTLEKQPILECSHKSTEQCHYTYVTQFKPSKEEICEESFDKKCSISFAKQARNETIQKCYTPLVKVCGEVQNFSPQSTAGNLGSSSSINSIPDILNQYDRKRLKRKYRNARESDQLIRRRPKRDSGENQQECKTYYETSCTTRYVEKSPGKFVGETSCEKLPIELCGQGCRVTEGEEECHDKTVVSLLDVPEEVCDLNPVKTCRFTTKLVPHLSPTHQCTLVPKEVCVLKFNTPKPVSKPLLTKWCLDMENTEERSRDIGEGSEGRSKSLSKANFNDGKNGFNSQSSQANQKRNNAVVENKEDYGSPSLEQYGSDQEQTARKPSDNYGVNNGRDFADYSDYSYDLSETENNYNEDTSNANDDNVVTPDERVKEIYEAPLDNIAIDEGYGAPSGDASQIYGAPPTSEDYENYENDEYDNYDSVSANEAYGAPADGVPIEEGYGSPTNKEKEVININENYGSPSIQPVVEDSGKELDSLYNAPPAEDYEDNLDVYNPALADEDTLNTYGKSDLQNNENSRESVNRNQIPLSNTYAIDSGFGQQPQYSYRGPSENNEDDLPGYSSSKPGLSRYLTPPLSTKIGKLTLLPENKSEKLKLLPKQEKPILKHSHEIFSSLQQAMRKKENNEKMKISKDVENGAEVSAKQLSFEIENLRIKDERINSEVIQEEAESSINQSLKSERLKLQQSIGVKKVPQKTKLPRFGQIENRNQIRSVDPNFRI